MRHWLHITCENLEKHSTESLNGVCSFGGVPGAQLKLEQEHTFTWAVTPNAASASSNAEITFAVTPGATLAEPSEGQVVTPGFRNTGEVILGLLVSFWDPAVPPAAFGCVSIGCVSAARSLSPLRTLDCSENISRSHASFTL